MPTAIAPMLDEYVPDTQFVHVRLLVALVAPDHVPAMQLVHADDPIDDHVPAKHTAHTAAEVAPATVDAVPAEQLRHAAPAAIE